MKLPSLLALAALLVASPVFGQDAASVKAEAAADSAPTAAATLSTTRPWSVVGAWDCTQQDWSDTLTLESDGSFHCPNEELSGRWALAPQGAGINLILYWNIFPAEVLTMNDAGEFVGNAARGHLRMRRHSVAPSSRTSRAVSPGALGGIEVKTWTQGQPPVKLVRADEGFCALTKVTGHFAGAGESVWVHVGDDGCWYLGGTSQQQDVGAECIVVRFHPEPRQKW